MSKETTREKNLPVHNKRSQYGNYPAQVNKAELEEAIKDKEAVIKSKKIVQK